jgi:DHA1 family bicyclomycin/chloramphenicol resistance-like MFS transporter
LSFGLKDTPPIEATAPRPNAPQPNAPLWLLALLTFSGTLAMHIFVPALPDAATDLGVSAGTIQMTVSLYILGLAFGQLFYGPLSDRLGRKPVMMAGLAVYAASGLIAALAPGAAVLISARLLQALGGCAGLVLGRAIVRDTTTSREAGRRLALMNLMVVVGPGLAPLIGGVAVAASGWRSILFGLAAFGLANLVCAWRLLPETARPTKVAAGTAADASIARHYRQLLRSRSFLGYSIGGGCATTTIYAYVAAAPFIFSGELHRPPHEIGVYLGLVIAGIFLGSALASRLLLRMEIDRLLVRANAVSVLAAFVFLAAVLTHTLSIPLIVATMFAFAVGVGIASPSALTQAISVNPQIIGSASGLYGFTQMTIGAACTAIAGMGSDPALAVALVLSTAGVVGQLSFWIAQRDKRAAVARRMG